VAKTKSIDNFILHIKGYLFLNGKRKYSYKKEKFLEGICHKFRNFKALERMEFLGILEGIL